MSKNQRIARIDGKILRSMIISGANKLAANIERINALNVFPVPDGDTGTNMSLTAIAAAKEVEKLDTEDVFTVSKAAASGALRGGRGNSGVIFSQIFRGFSKALEGLSTNSIGPTEIARALTNASKTAYKAVMRPQEGTMLTVARYMSEVAERIAGNYKDLEDFAADILKEGQIILKKTPEMLPILKQAGVVDSGGEGLVVFFAGAIEGMRAKDIQLVLDVPQAQNEVKNTADFTKFSAEEINFGYCTEFFIITSNFNEAAEARLKSYMETMGDSIALVADDEIVKIHIHTDRPGAVMEKAMAIGPLSNLKIENMRLQHQGLAESVSVLEEKEVGVVVVSSGMGFRKIFEELGADCIIEGGQTMNPSAEDIAQSISQVRAENVIVLPNNKNTVLAAQQAVEFCEGKNVSVIETKSMPQGVAALVSYDPDATLEENLESMADSCGDVVTGQITVAVRNTALDGKEVREGDFIGILDGKIVCTHPEIDILAKELLNIMMVSTPDILTMYVGEKAEASPANASIEAYIRENYSDCELDIAFGGQAIYHYIFSAE